MLVVDLEIWMISIFQLSLHHKIKNLALLLFHPAWSSGSWGWGARVINLNSEENKFQNVCPRINSN